MSKYRFFPLLFTAALLLCATWVKAQPQQGKILFETFTNSCDPCPDGLRPDFESAVNDVLSSDGSKIIWFNYHVGNFCDPMAQSGVGTGTTNTRLAGGPGVIYIGAVNRTDFGNGHATGTGTNWTAQVDQSGGNPPATITLTNATIDKTSSGTYYKVHADITVTATTTISDKINLFAAVLQDGVMLSAQSTGYCKQSPGKETTGPYNSVVRVVTTGTGLSVFNGASSGDSKTIPVDISIHNPTTDPLYDFTKMRLIAFLEESSSATDYHVVNAVDLHDNLDNLPHPTPTLKLDETLLNDSTFHSGESIFISYAGSFLVNGVRAYYSLDGGSNWRMIADSASGNIHWTVPDSATTSGKIKLVSVDDATLTSVESGTFSIVHAANVAWLQPDPTKLKDFDTVKGGTTYHLQWSESGVSTVKLEYAYHITGTPVWLPIASNVSGTSYDWKVPDTAYIIDIRIVPTEQSVAPQITHMTLTKTTIIDHGSVSVDVARDFAIRQVYPNPSTGQNITVQYTSTKQKPIMVELLDLLGHEVYDERLVSMPSGDVQISTVGLAPGSYFLRMSDGEQAITKRIEILK